MNSLDGYSSLWNNFKNQYKPVLGSAIFFSTYIEPSSIVYFDDETIVISCENSLAEKFFTKRYDSVNSVFTEIIGHECTLVFSSDKEETANFIKISKTGEGKLPDANETRPAVESKVVSFRSSEDNSNLISKYTFDNFVVGDNCRQAYSVATQIAANPGVLYNPVFIYASSGLGKTHLLHAIGNEIRKNNPEKRILYIPTETFTTDYISSIQNNRMDEFRLKYRSVDVLLIDDIQFIANKSGTQEEFFNTFNELYAHDKQIVICSDCRISEINALAERLKTRFENGFQTTIAAPDYEVRYAIMLKKSEDMEMDISREIIDSLAQSELTNVREIEGILNQFKLLASHGEKITMEAAKNALSHLNISEIKEVNTELILDVVSRYFDVKVEDILSKNRARELVKARHIAMYLCRTTLGYSYQKIADDFGGLNHSSVLDGCKNVQERYHTDEDVKAYVEEIKKLIS
ncbi:MAG: chromosomal replication initiator protein DnaA [Clostridia bacterium]|nr:chromosomal replication initiator protein DnaA [Clostridia bacterium]